MRSDFEQEIRDALRRADSMAIPVRPLDPDEIVAAASTAGSVRWRSGAARQVLAVAAVILLVAGAGAAVWATLGRSGAVPAAPAAASTEYRVEVDIYSGRPNPQLILDPLVGRELYLMIDDLDAAGLLTPTDPPEFGLEFRGFVVSPSDPSLRVLRIVPKTVYSIRAGTYEQYVDTGEGFYTRVYHAVASQLPAGVPEALPTAAPSLPELTAPMPPSVGDPATWTLADPAAVNAASTTLTLSVTRLGCSGGKTGEVLEPTFSTSGTQIIIRANVTPRTGPASCPGNDSVRVTLELNEPVGARVLLDAACLEGVAVPTSSCVGGAVRWTP